MRQKPKKHRKILPILGIIILLIIIYIVSSLGTLRMFIPNYFKLAGYPGTERSYLIIFQNNYELRPTGGFISAAGILKFNNSLLSSIEFFDVYEKFNLIDKEDYIKPPYPLEEILGEDENYPGYAFHDANFHPDFPTSAEELIGFYNQSFPDTKLDGVFAVDYSIIEDLIGVLGPIEAGNELFTKNNLFEKLEYIAYNIDLHSIEDLKSRKNIMKDLAGILIKEAAFSPLKLRSVSDVVANGLSSKHILLYFRNDSMENKMRNRNWAGELKKEGDPENILSIVESNLGGMKSDRYMHRNIKYIIDFKKDSEGKLIPSGDITISFENNSEKNEPVSGDYRGYIRTYLPEGTELISVGPSQKDTKNLTEENFETIKYFGDIISVNTGERLELNYKFKLPKDLLNENTMSLLLRKQPGTMNDFYTVIFKVPQGMSFESGSLVSTENLAVYRGFLENDKTIDIKILEDTLPPRVNIQKATSLNEIYLRFNEPINENIAIKPENYSIEDADFNNQNNTDILKVNKIRFQNEKEVYLELTGMTKQKEEHYKVIIFDIEDTSGNVITPNPKEITVVQR